MWSEWKCTTPRFCRIVATLGFSECTSDTVGPVPTAKDYGSRTLIHSAAHVPDSSTDYTSDNQPHKRRFHPKLMGLPLWNPQIVVTTFTGSYLDPAKGRELQNKNPHECASKTSHFTL